MSLNIKTSGSEDYGRTIKALICGPPGAGKTLTSSTWPNVIYASAEGGLMSVADRKVNYVDIDSTNTLLELKKILSQPADVREKMLGFKAETVVLDTIDEIQRIFIRERLIDQRRDALLLQDWGWLGERMIATVNGFRNLDMNVVFTAHLKEVKDEETGKVWLKPGLQGAIADQIPAYVDLAFVLKSDFKSEIVDNKPVKKMIRSFQTLPDPYSSWVKDRSGKIPNPFLLNFEDDYDRLASYVFKGYDDIPDSTSHEVNAVIVEEEPKKSPTVVQREQLAKSEVVENPVTETTATEEPTSKVDLGYGFCSECQNPVETKEVATLSRLRCKKLLDKECYERIKAQQ